MIRIPKNPAALFAIVLLFIACKEEEKKIKIACVGDSITYGMGIPDRTKNSYPAQLQNLLGKNYQVKNFGRNSATLLKKGNVPYWNTQAYQRALAFEPDMVYIKLGSNDSKQINRKHYKDFIADYKALIQSFEKLPSHPKVTLLLPIPSFLQDKNSIYDSIIKNNIIPMIQKVAFQTNAPVIDLYHIFTNKESLIPDKVHPNSFGANIIAKRLFEDLKNNFVKKQNSILKKLNLSKLKPDNFYGFPMYNFSFQNRDAKIVCPKRTLKNTPWIWRARFWGHEPQTDIALLERGFHLVYCDVAGLLGNEKAVQIWNDFYKFIQKGGLNKKAVLEAMSRGGLIAYHWAMQNPEKIACIYADAPVLDGRSWPGGLYKGQGG